MNEKDPLFDEIKNAPENKEYTAQGWNPIYSVNPEAEILIIGQAPGKRVQDTEVMWNDKSGDRLRDWMGISRDTFYHSHKIAVIPMDFYYPGRGKSGDLPPRKGVADNWHPRLLELMPNIKLTILIGNYSQKYYLPEDKKLTTTAIVKNYQKYLPKYFPIVHPSPRNNIWLAKNPWFETDVVPELQKIVQQSL